MLLYFNYKTELFKSLRKVESVVLGDSDWDAKGERLVGATDYICDSQNKFHLLLYYYDEILLLILLLL
jgi:hypothetical protein